MRRRMFGIAEAMVGSAAFLDQQFAPHRLQGHSSVSSPHTHSQLFPSHFQLLRNRDNAQ